MKRRAAWGWLVIVCATVWFASLIAFVLSLIRWEVRDAVLNLLTLWVSAWLSHRAGECWQALENEG